MQALPQALAAFGAYRQFMLYKKVPSRTRPGKTDKFPVNLSGEVVSAHDAQYWTDAATACATATLWGEPYGVAFAFTEADPFWFLDVDDCLVGDPPDWSATARMLLSRFPGACVEVSQSGRGLHLFGSGRCPVPSNERNKKAAGFDLYTEGRFVALTGDRAMGDAGTDHTPALQQLVADFLTPEALVPGGVDGWTDEPREDWAGPVDDDELLTRMLRSRSSGSAFGGKAAFADLYECNVDVLASTYPPDQGGEGYDESAADMALAQHLAFWTGCDCERMLRLMQGSALARDKWEHREDYLPNTILKAVRQQRDVYHSAPAADPIVPPAPEQIAAAVEGPGGFGRDISLLAPVDGDPFLPADRQLELFAGCVYVTDRHQIFSPHGMLDQGRFKALYGGWSFVMDLNNRRTVRNAWECFTESQAVRFPKVSSVCFRPKLEPGAIVREGSMTRVNTYKPVNTPRIAGDPSPFLGLVQRMLPDERDRRILLTYLAACIQHKGEKFQWWPVVQGAKGNGKTMLLSAMRYALSEQYCFAPNVAEIAKSGNKFNGWLEGRLFIAMEEVFVAERRSFLEEFKTTITNDWVPVERKGVDQAMGDNCANGLMATNHRNGVPVDDEERRYCVFLTAQQHGGDLVRDGMDGAYFPDLYDWAKGRNAYAHLGAGYGFAVIHDYLATYPLDPEFNPAGMCQRAPLTSSSEMAFAESLGPVEQAIQEVIGQGRQGFAGGWVSSMALDRLLDELKVAGRISHQLRREMMRTLGYDWHPGLTDGRVNNPILPDNGKPRLYVKRGSPEAALVGPVEIAKAYKDAQMM